MKPNRTIPLVAMAMSITATALTAELSLETAPPVVVKTIPIAGATGVDPALAEIQVTYSKAMQDGSWSWSTWSPEAYPETAGSPHYLADRRTCVLPVKLQTGRFYAIWLNSDRFKNFKDTAGIPAVPYLLTFTTAATNVASIHPLPKAEELPGKLTFHGRYRHRSRGSDIATPSELWLSESPDGGVSALARLPFSESSELASGNREHQLISHRIGRDAVGGQGSYRVELEFTNATARLTRRGIRQESDGKELNVPDGAFFDPNSRPDSYCAANILLRAFAVRDGETKDFPVFDWDNSGEEFASYTIRVRHAGKEKVEVPAGIFEANHLVLTQVTSADTWFKKRAGHVTDFWVLDNHVIVRVLRHREPYEMVLLDHTVPENLGALPGSQGQATLAKSPASKATGPAQPILEVPRGTELWLTNLNDNQRAVLAWTDRQFRSFFDQRTFAGWSEQERADLEQRLLDALNGPRTREYYQAINSLAALGSTNALPALCALAFDRQDKDNRDRWMAIRALGILGDKSAISDLIPLVYHGNSNTHWWAQISLVRLTGQNLGSDWSAWGKWWNESGGQPTYSPEIIRWWNGQPEDAKLAETLTENDRKFLESIGAIAAPKPETTEP